MDGWAGRIVGDGIHAMIPNLGQGGCQAIEDSYVLMEELEQPRNDRKLNG
jgi:zeaxanthin epoxidase